MAFACYIDDDFGDLDFLHAALARGRDFVRAADVGMRGSPDSEHLAYAAQHSRVLLTANMGDFERLHWEWLAAGSHHAGIVLIAQQKWSVGEVLRRLERLLQAKTAGEMVDRIEWLSRWGELRDP